MLYIVIFIFREALLRDTLIIGLEQTIPASHTNYEDLKMQEPVVVGYASTVDKRANVTNGGYFFQVGKQTIIEARRLGRSFIFCLCCFTLVFLS